MSQKVVIPCRCAPPEPESRPFNNSSKPYYILDSRFTVRPAECPGMTRKGFTLIELLVVVLIIGILAGVALPLYNKAVFKAQLAQVLLQGRSIRNDIQMYHLANGVWPKNMDDLTVWDYIDEKGIAHIGKVSYTNQNNAYMTTNSPLVSASDFFQCAIWFTELEPPFCTTRIGAAAKMLEANGWKWRHTNEASNSTSYYMPL